MCMNCAASNVNMNDKLTERKYDDPVSDLLTALKTNTNTGMAMTIFRLFHITKQRYICEVMSK
jgi:hypothetical protein